MTTLELTFALTVLLVTPGPTNTLLFVAGTERGLSRSLPLIPAELAGYLAAVLPLMLIGGALLQRYPSAQPVITVLAGLWVAVLAVRLARPSQASLDEGTVSARLIFVTTILNPKALIFGLVLLPGPAAAFNLALFAGLVVVVAAGWAATGAILSTASSRNLFLMRKVAAVWLAAVAATLMLRGLTA